MEAYPETPEASQTWGCDYFCDSSWQQRGDDPIYFHQCPAANTVIYTADGIVQSRHVMRIIDELGGMKHWTIEGYDGTGTETNTDIR